MKKPHMTKVIDTLSRATYTPAAQIVEATGLPVATVYRALTALRKKGQVRRNGREWRKVV